MNSGKADEELQHELMLYTLQKGDAEFIHQYVVDAYAAQHASAESKPITTMFALAGLYLHLEKGFTGKEVQQAHMKMAQKRKEWLRFELPKEFGDVTVAEVVAAPAGAARDEMIEKWMQSVWTAWSGSHERVRELLSELNIV